MKRFKIIVDIIGVLVCLIGGVFSSYIRFTNPNMSETQLFIEFLREWLILILMLMSCLFIHIKLESNDIEGGE